MSRPLAGAMCVALAILAVLPSGLGHPAPGASATSMPENDREIPPGAAGASSVPSTSLAGGAVGLTSGNVDPTDVALTWPAATSSTFAYDEIDASYNGPNGTWYPVRWINDPSTSGTVVDRLAPGATTYFRQVLYLTSGTSVTSPALAVTTATTADLRYIPTSSTSGTLTWNNNASYGSRIGFVCYTLLVISNHSDTAGGCLPNLEGDQTTTVQGLTALQPFSFEIETVDRVLDGSPVAGGENVSSFSSPAGLNENGSEPIGGVVEDQGTAHAGQQFVFDVLPSGGTPPYNVTWSLQNGTVFGYGLYAAHVFPTGGDTYIEDEITSSGGGGLAELPVSVLARTVVSGVADHSVVAPGTWVNFTGNTTNPGWELTSYTWDFGAGVMGYGKLARYDFPPPIQGSIVITVVATDFLGESAVTELIEDVSPLAGNVVAPGFSWALTGTLLNWFATPSGGAGGPYTLSWDFGDGGTSAGRNVSHTYLGPGNYTIRLMLGDVLGHEATLDVGGPLAIYAPLQVRIVAGTASPEVGSVDNLSATITGGSGAGDTCQWTSGPTSIEGCVVSLRWTDPGLHNLSLIVQDPVVGNASAALTVEVAPAHAPPAPVFPVPGADWRVWAGIGAAAVVLALVLLVVYRRHR